MSDSTETPTTGNTPVSATPDTDIVIQLEKAITCAFNANDMNNVARLLDMKIDLLRNPIKPATP